MLGVYHDQPGEFVIATEEEAVAAIERAFAAAARYRHVDPAISADEARRLRIALALGEKVP